jgi:hypothetical protein
MVLNFPIAPNPLKRPLMPIIPTILRKANHLAVMLHYLVPLTLILSASAVHAQQIPLQTLVTPSTIIAKEGHPVSFALHGFLEFNSLAELFSYIDSQTTRWNDSLSDAQRRDLAADLLRRGIESRVISMTDERPLETLITHTEQELRDALGQVHEPTPPGYAEVFLATQKKWKHSLNCWSAAPSIPARVLSNWYPIEEGILLYGATYDSTEHFWQAVKYHPDVTLADLTDLLSNFQRQDWKPWLAHLDDNPKLYIPNAYAIEFLRHNLAPDRLRWFRNELQRHSLQPTDHARSVQQRVSTPLRFTAFEEKVFWGDLADLFHLVYTFSSPDDPIRNTLVDRHFDAIYLENRQFPFISQQFRSLMLEIWKVKYLQIPRFRELIGAIPLEIQLSHFLNDGDSPDIPIPTYIDYLNQIRRQARAHPKSATQNP